MSEEQKETGKEPATNPALAAQADEPALPEPGRSGQQLQKANLPFTPLGADSCGVEMIQVSRDDLLRVGQHLRQPMGFDLLLSCSGIDWKTHRETVYHLYSTQAHTYLAVKVQADEQDHSPSLMPVWEAADWHERESYDLMGIHYDGHPNLTRILMPSDWLGHPLRKDYKVDDPRLVWNER